MGSTWSFGRLLIAAEFNFLTCTVELTLPVDVVREHFRDRQAR